MPLGPWELVIILVIVVVIFGAGRLSQIGGALGKSVREFRSATQDELPAPSTGPTAVTSTTSTTSVVSPAPTAVRTCPACGHANTHAVRFCSECGAELATPEAEAAAPAVSAPEVTCPSCATLNPPGQTFCGQCGARLSRAA